MTRNRRNIKYVNFLKESTNIELWKQWQSLLELHKAAPSDVLSVDQSMPIFKSGIPQNQNAVYKIKINVEQPDHASECKIYMLQFWWISVVPWFTIKQTFGSLPTRGLSKWWFWKKIVQASWLLSTLITEQGTRRTYGVVLFVHKTKTLDQEQKDSNLNIVGAECVTQNQETCRVNCLGNAPSENKLTFCTNLDSVSLLYIKKQMPVSS